LVVAISAHVFPSIRLFLVLCPSYSIALNEHVILVIFFRTYLGSFRHDLTRKDYSKIIICLILCIILYGQRFFIALIHLKFLLHFWIPVTLKAIDLCSQNKEVIELELKYNPTLLPFSSYLGNSWFIVTSCKKQEGLSTAFKFVK
jgi:hypothetical protein